MKPRYILTLIVISSCIVSNGWADTTGSCDFRIPCNPGSYLPHPCDCTLLFHCGASNWILKTCENGTKWDQSLLSCNHDDDVVAPCDSYCTKKIGFEESTTATMAPGGGTKEECETDHVIPYPTDCSRNLDYKTQIWVTWDCSNITAWNGTNEDVSNTTVDITTADITTPPPTTTTTQKEGVPPPSSKIYGLDKVFFICIIAASIGVFLLLVLLLVCYLTCCERKSKDKEEQKSEKKKSKKEFEYEDMEKTRYTTTIQVD